MADLNIGFSAVATGTADVITATYSPAITLSDRRIVFLRIVTPNTTTTPTFNPNSLGAQTITKNNGDPLAVGDLDGVVILMYDLANTNWELLTPKGLGSFTLAQILAIGNSTGGLNIVSPDGDQYLSITDAIAMFYSDGGINGAFAGVMSADGQSSMEGGDNDGDGNVVVNKTQVLVQHTDLINLDAPSVRLTQETASRVAILDASKDIVGADTATYPSLTELANLKGVTSAIQTQLNAKEPAITTLPISKGGTNSGTALNNGRVMISSAGAIIEGDTGTYPSTTELAYVKGVTSAIQTQLNNKKSHIHFFSMASNTVGDLQTYYFGQMFGTLSTTTTQSGATPMRAGTIVGAIIATYNGGTVGSNEACTLNLLHGSSFGTTDLITNALTVDANRQAVQVVSGLSITVTDCNALCQITTPSIGTNPNGWQIRIIFIYQ